jgi:hypothetical protein
MMWLALVVATAISLTAIVFTWRTSRRNLPSAPLPARTETAVALAPNLLPVISQAIKEALVQELSAQRRELLASQQAAAAELAALARRLEAVQAPLLERLAGCDRPPCRPQISTAKFPSKFFARAGKNIPLKSSPWTAGCRFQSPVRPAARMARIRPTSLSCGFGTASPSRCHRPAAIYF